MKFLDTEFTSKTSWSTDQLNLLSNINNHKIAKDKDGYYRWYNNILGYWSIHSIKYFTDYKKPASWLYFWVHNWTEELSQRKLKQNRIESKKRTEVLRKVRRLKTAFRKTTQEKIIELKVLVPEFTQQEIANELDISLSTVKRALNT